MKLKLFFLVLALAITTGGVVQACHVQTPPVQPPICGEETETVLELDTACVPPVEPTPEPTPEPSPAPTPAPAPQPEPSLPVVVSAPAPTPAPVSSTDTAQLEKFGK